MKKVLIIIAFSIFFIQSVSAQQKAFDVKVYGKGQPVILIPGYSCSGAVWNETVDHLKERYQLHVLTIAGYAGVQPIASPVLKTVRDSIISYVRNNHLYKPILIGHSLGAFMSLWVSSEAPSLFGKIICVDGLPFVTAIGNAAITVDSVKNDPRYNEAMVVKSFESLPDSNYESNMTRAMLWQVRDTTRAKQIARWSYLSDRKTLGHTIIEMSLTDLRESLMKITQPVLVLGSIYQTKESSIKVMNEQYTNLPNKNIVIANSKHFIMYDVPEWFYQQVDTFLQQ
jgi:N-formylmaleamate deformylase